MFLLLIATMPAVVLQKLSAQQREAVYSIDDVVSAITAATTEVASALHQLCQLLSQKRKSVVYLIAATVSTKKSVVY